MLLFLQTLQYFILSLTFYIMSQLPSSNTNLHDVITEESPPAYTPYPNSGEQSMAFGPNRPFSDNTTQSIPIPQQQQNNYQVSPNQHINQAPLQNYNVQYHNYANNNPVGGNVYYSFTRPSFTRPSTHTVIPINTEVITKPLRYIANQINQLAYSPSSGINSNFTQIANSQSNVIYVNPGDPSIGGWLCPNCQGTGRVNQQLCTRCNGFGRVFDQNSFT